MSISETADSFLKGIINVHDADTRELLGVDGFTIVQRDIAFPGMYNFSTGHHFIERGFRGDVGGADYDALAHSDDPISAQSSIRDALSETIGTNIPDYFETILPEDPYSSYSPEVKSALANLKNIRITGLPNGQDSPEARTLRLDISFLMNLIDQETGTKTNDGSPQSISSSLDYALRMYFNVIEDMGKRPQEEFYNNRDVRNEIRRFANQSAQALGRAYSKMLVGYSNPLDVANLKNTIRNIARHLGGGPTASPALEEFARSLSFMEDIHNTYSPDKEEIIEQRLADCARDVASYCGVDYNGQPPGMFIYRLSLNCRPDLFAQILDMTHDAFDDCLNIADS